MIENKLGIVSMLDAQVADFDVVEYVRRTIALDSSGIVELNGVAVDVPIDCEYSVVTKSLIVERYDIGFGSCIQVVVAVGGVKSVDGGVIEANVCFSTVWYSLSGEVITIDFMESSRTTG